MDGETKRAIRKTANTNSLMLILLIILIYGFIFTVRRLLPYVVDTSSEKYETIYELAAYIVQYVIAFPIAIRFFKHTEQGKTFRVFGCFHRSEIKVGRICRLIIIAIGITYATSIVVNLISLLFQKASGISLNTFTLQTKPSRLGYFVTFFSAVGLAPFFEELMFRATLFRSTAKHGVWCAAIISGLSFGLFHMNYTQVFYAFMLGIISSILIAKTHSIIPSLITHMIINEIGALISSVTAVLDISQLSNMEYIKANLLPSSILIVLGLLEMGLVFAGIILLIVEIVTRKDEYKFKSADGISAIKKIGTYLSAPASIILYIGLIAITVYNALK